MFGLLKLCLALVAYSVRELFLCSHLAFLSCFSVALAEEHSDVMLLTTELWNKTIENNGMVVLLEVIV